MAMVVAHNIPALQTYNVINNTSSALQKSINKLSTGLRINSAADDAAGLAISEKMRAQVRGLDQAVANSQDGISMIQTAEGALSETHSILQRMRELSVQAANDTLTQQDRGYIQEEVDQLREEITRIGNTTQFNKKKLLNGDAAVLWSSDKNTTKAIVNGGLRQIDQFGQKKSIEGNYNINIKADPGQGEVQKSDIFKIKHPDVVVNKNLNTETGVTDVEVHDVPAATYSMNGVDASGAAAQLTGTYGIGGTKSTSQVKITPNQAGQSAASNTTTITIKLNGKTLGTTAAIAGNATVDDQKNAVKAIADDLKGAAAKQGVQLTTTDGETFDLVRINSGDAPTKDDFSVEYSLAGFGVTPGITTEVDPTSSTVKVSDVLDVAAGTIKQTNASTLFEVTDVDQVNKTATVKVTADILAATGGTDTKTTTLTFKEGEATKLDDIFGDTSTTVTIKDVSSLGKGSKWVYSFVGSDADMGMTLSATADTSWPEGTGKSPLWDATADSDKGGAATVTYGLMDSVAGKDIHIKNFFINDKTGEATEGEIVLSTDSKFTKTNVKADAFVGSFDAAYIGKVAAGDTKLRDLDKFWDSEGNFMLTDPQTITLTQGDGTQASVTLYANDTLDDVAEKLNDAVANGLGQAKYVGDAGHFVTFTGDAGTKNSESVAGTFLIRSVVPGANGKISMSGNEAVINAFSLNTIQDAKETNYTINVKDAHTNANVVTDFKTTGNIAMGLIHENIDVEFDAMSGITANWDANKKAYTYTANAKGVDTTLHLSDNTTVFQIGANEGEDMGVNIGDMRSHALGLDSVNVTNRSAASRSITVIDNAIDKVSMQRSKLGAYQNRLEHTINNLNTASENLTSAESRIRDTDMAKEMMNFSKLQIMLQAGNSMLAQANQLPQNVLSLVR